MKTLSALDLRKKLKELSARMDEWRAKHREETTHLDVIKAVREMRDN